MKKLVIALSILSLVSISSFFILKKDNYSFRYLDNSDTLALSNDLSQKDEVTIDQYTKCCESNDWFTPCVEDEAYKEAQRQLKEASEFDYDCNQFNGLLSYCSLYFREQLVNYGNYFKNCFFNPKLKSINYSNSCLKNKYEIQVKCAGL